MAQYTVQNITRDTTGGGLNPTFTAVSASDTFAPSAGDTFLYVKNASGGSVNVNVQVPAGRDPIPFMPYSTQRQYAVPAGQDRIFGPFPAGYFADPVTGLCTVTYGSTTSITAAAFNLTSP